jgi:hypothetical protein
MLAWWGMTRGRGPVLTAGRLERWTGGVIIGYGMLVYPLLGWMLGHAYPESPTFGLPCPTTITTLGVLVLITPKPPWFLLVIPIGWAVVGTSAAVTLGIFEDLGLLSAAVAVVAARRHGRRQPARRTHRHEMPAITR